MSAVDVVLLQAQLDDANARAERAEGQFRACDLELNALKAKHRQTLIELEDVRRAKCFWCGLVAPTPDEKKH